MRFPTQRLADWLSWLPLPALAPHGRVSRPRCDVLKASGALTGVQAQCDGNEEGDRPPEECPRVADRSANPGEARDPRCRRSFALQVSDLLPATGLNARQDASYVGSKCRDASSVPASEMPLNLLDGELRSANLPFAFGTHRPTSNALGVPAKAPGQPLRRPGGKLPQRRIPRIGRQEPDISEGPRGIHHDDSVIPLVGLGGQASDISGLEHRGKREGGED